MQSVLRLSNCAGQGNLFPGLLFRFCTSSCLLSSTEMKSVSALLIFTDGKNGVMVMNEAAWWESGSENVVFLKMRRQ